MGTYNYGSRNIHSISLIESSIWGGGGDRDEEAVWAAYWDCVKLKELFMLILVCHVTFACLVMLGPYFGSGVRGWGLNYID
jgi:hypothetical protein